MPLKEYGAGPGEVIHRWDGGLSWMAHPDEGFQRTSHALVVGGEDGPRHDADGDSSDPPVWLVDPVDAEAIDDELAALGSVAGVVVLSTYHRRDAEAFAGRYDVPIYLPERVSGIAGELDAPVERFQGKLADTGFRAIPTVRFPWKEAVLYHPGRKTLVAADSLITMPDRTAPDERLAVISYLRLFPPRDALGGLDVERVLVGHGPGVFEDAQAALEDALAGARWGAPRVLARNLPDLLRSVYVTLRD